MKIGHNLNPTKRLGKHRKEGYSIKMSCGGGMGGSKWWEYVTDIDSDDPNYESVTCLDGQTKRLGKRFIVNIVPVDFYGQTVDISDWCDGRIRKSDNPVYTEWFAVDKGEEVTWTDGKGDRDDRNCLKQPCLTEYHALEEVEDE